MDKGPNNKGQHEEARLKRKLILEEKRRKRMAFSQRNEQILLRAHHGILNLDYFDTVVVVISLPFSHFNKFQMFFFL